MGVEALLLLEWSTLVLLGRFRLSTKLWACCTNDAGRLAVLTESEFVLFNKALWFFCAEVKLINISFDIKKGSRLLYRRR